MTQRVLLAVLQTLFPGWKIDLDHGVWVAHGKCLIRATNADLLVESLYEADPDAVREAADLFLGDPTSEYTHEH